MAKPQTDIESTQDGLTIIKGSNPSKTTSHKIEQIAQFIAENREQLGQSQNLITALKEKLIREADGDLDLVQKVKEFSPGKIKGALEILVVKAPEPKNLEQFLRNIELFVKHHPDYMLGNHMEVIDISKGGIPKEWEPEKLLSTFREHIAHFSKGFSQSQLDYLELKAAPLLKPITFVKWGLIIEDKEQLTNDVMHKQAQKLLMHQTPIVVNRDFLLAHRHEFLFWSSPPLSNPPLTVYHQKGGNFTVILPENVESLEKLGFNAKELVKGSLKDLLPLEEEEPDHALDRLLITETSDQRFARIGVYAGHGNINHVAGLPIQQFTQTQKKLHTKGMLYEVLLSCYAGGSNIAKINENPFPVIVMSSSEVSSQAGWSDSSYNELLEYAKNCLNKGKISLLIPQPIPLSPQSLLENEGVRETFEKTEIYNTPTIIVPKAAHFGLEDFRGLKRLSDKEVFKTIEIKEEGHPGFVSGGGTSHHIVHHVVSEISLEALVENTFALLDLSGSETKKGIFIQDIKSPLLKNSKDPLNLKNVVLYASKEENFFIISAPGLYCKATPDPKEGYRLQKISEEEAVFLAYSCFAQTINPKGREGFSQFQNFQKNFFNEAVKTPLLDTCSSLIQAYYEDHETIQEEFQKKLMTLKELKPDQLQKVKDLSLSFNLKTYANMVDKAHAPDLIKHIWRQEGIETLEYLKIKLKESENPLLLLLEPDLEGKTPLCWALHLKQEELADCLIQLLTLYAHRNNICYWDRSAFFEACRVGNTTMAQKILHMGVNKLELDRETALYVLSEPDLSNAVIEFLIENTDKKELATTLPLLVTHAKYQLLEHILQNQPPMIAKSILSLSLNGAFKLGDKKSLEILCKYGADPNVPDLFGDYPILKMCKSSLDSDKRDCLKLLLEKGAKVDLKINGETPLLWAIVKRDIPLFELLIQHGAPLNAAGEFKRICIDPELKEIALRACTLAQIDKNAERHPLAIALCAGDYETAESLLKKGVTEKEGSASLILDYLFISGRNASLEALDWILSHKELYKGKWIPALEFAIQYAPLNVISGFENLLEKKGINLKNSGATQYSFIFALRRKAANYGLVNRLKLKSDHKSFAAYLDIEEDDKIVLYCLNRLGDFRNLDHKLVHAEKVLDLLLEAVVKKCPKESFKPFYHALQKEDFEAMNLSLENLNKSDFYEMWNYFPPLMQLSLFLNGMARQSPFPSFYSALLAGNLELARQSVQGLSDQDITALWSFFPPSSILIQMKSPSDEMICFVYSLMEKGQVEKIKDLKRLLPSLQDMYAACKDHPEMQKQIGILYESLIKV